MSHFTNQLEIALTRCQLSRVELAKKCGLSYGTITNYAIGRTPPTKGAMRDICCALPPSEAALLLCERLKDEVPDEHASLIIVEPRAGSLLIEETQAIYDPLPPKLEDAMRKLRAAMIRSPEWADIVVDIAKVL